MLGYLSADIICSEKQKPLPFKNSILNFNGTEQFQEKDLKEIVGKAFSAVGKLDCLNWNIMRLIC